MPRRSISLLTNPVKLMTKIVTSPDLQPVHRRRDTWFPKASRPEIGSSNLKTLVTIAAIGMALCASSPVAADVVVFDQIAAVNQPVFVKVMTKGRFFPAGGQRISLQIDAGRPLPLLSGGDGYAYYKFIPRKAGIFQLEAATEDSLSSGTLLVVKPTERLLIIDAEGGLRTAAFSEGSRSESLDALKKLSRRYHLVYVTRWVGSRMLKQWLAEKKYPPSVVLKWKGPEFFERLQRQDISVAAAIGSNSLLEASRQHVERRYSFDETSHGTTVNDWAEIVKLLEAGNPNGVLK